MKKIDRIEKVSTKWVKGDIKAETLEKVQQNLPQDRTITQREFIDSLIIKGLGV